MSHKQIATALTVPVQIDRIVAANKYYSDGKFSFGVLSHGTCFFPKSDDYAKDANALLDRLVNVHLDCVVREMDDHNFVVRFIDQVFGIVFKDEFEANRTAIEEDARSQSSDEVLVGVPGMPPHHLLVGLFARTRLIKDIECREIVRTIE
jgi:hypothetical protein